MLDSRALRRLQLGFTSLTAVLGAGCFTDVLPGSETSESSGGEGTMSTTSTSAETVVPEGSGPSDCAPAQLCAPVAPPEWFGPVAVSDLLGGGDCPAGWTEELIAHELLAVPDDADCQCPCALENGRCETVVELHSEASCSPPVRDIVTLGAGDCLPIGDGVSGTHYFFQQPPLHTGGCSDAPLIAVPPAELASILACAPPALGEDCAAGVCVPQPPEGFESLCVLRPGDAECPPPFPARRVLFETLNDARSCGSCDCQLTAQSCNGDARVSTDPACEDGDQAIGPCMAGGGGNGNPHYVTYFAAPPECSLLGDALPIGEFTTTDPVTVCCVN